MKKNMGTVDRGIRLLLAILMGWLWYSGQVAGALGLVLVVLAAIFLVTSLIGFCPLYTPFGFSTCKREAV